MEQNEFYEVNNIIIKISKDRYEVDKLYKERVIFVLNNIKKYGKKIDSKEINMYINMSRIYINEKFLKCKYLSS